MNQRLDYIRLLVVYFFFHKEKLILLIEVTFKFWLNTTIKLSYSRHINIEKQEM